MKFTLDWLKRHLDTTATLNEISTRLTELGLEVEEIEDRAKDYAAFKVAYVEKAEKHPDADRLRVCTVNTGLEKLQVVCGAPNAKTGMKAIFAPTGSTIPATGDVLKKGVIRGVESNGMLVSEREMNLSDEHEGIIELPEDVEIGTPMAEIFGLNDPIIDIALTPDRGDCAGVRGIARDLAASGLGTLKPLEKPSFTASGTSSISVTLDDDCGCSLFLGRVITGVKNGPSPDWLQAKLKAVGLRPISALVDITNYFSIDLSRPLHVYDFDKLQGNIRVSTAKGGEELDALNDKSYVLNGGEIAIFDDRGVIGLGGVVGGESTGSDEGTTNVFLEAAIFDPMRIARTGRDLQIDSDARYRFERGIDGPFTFEAIDLASQMIIDLCGGEASDIMQAGEIANHHEAISYDPALCLKRSGMDVAPQQQKEILELLGFSVNDKGEKWSVTAPSWRHDIDGPADLVEEVIRIIGYDSLPLESVRSAEVTQSGAETTNVKRARLARAALAVRGMHECVTWSFVQNDVAQLFSEKDTIDPGLTLSNPISVELDTMRPSILPNLIQAAVRNTDRAHANTALFEVGPIFESAAPNGYQTVAAGIRSGKNGPKHWADQDSDRDIDVYDAKADAIAALEQCGAPAANAQISKDVPSYYHPGRAGSIRLGPKILATFGEIHPAILEKFGLDNVAVGFEIHLSAIPEPKKKGGTQKPLLTLHTLQPLTRDFAFLVDDNVAALDVTKAIAAVEKSLITDVAIFDVYKGQGVADGQKSLAVRVTLQPTEKTLTDNDIEQLSNAIIENVSKKTGGILRG